MNCAGAKTLDGNEEVGIPAGTSRQLRIRVFSDEAQTQPFNLTGFTLTFRLPVRVSGVLTNIDKTGNIIDTTGGIATVDLTSTDTLVDPGTYTGTARITNISDTYEVARVPVRIIDSSFA